MYAVRILRVHDVVVCLSARDRSIRVRERHHRDDRCVNLRIRASRGGGPVDVESDCDVRPLRVRPCDRCAVGGLCVGNGRKENEKSAQCSSATK